MQDQSLDPRLRRIGIISLLILIMGAAIAFALYSMFKPNPYGDSTKIKDLNKNFPSLPENRGFQLEATLRQILALNNSDNSNIPSSGAIIRPNSVKTTQDPINPNLYQSVFIVDIESLGQSYQGYLEWSADPKVNQTLQDSLYFSCLPEDQLIYGHFDCADISQSPTATDATTSDDIPPSTNTASLEIMNKLPKTYEYYTKDGIYVYYQIAGYYQFKNSQKTVLIRIFDYAGNGYDLALARIQKLGYNPADYEIEYINKFTPNARAD